MPDDALHDVRGDIASFFGELHREFGLRDTEEPAPGASSPPPAPPVPGPDTAPPAPGVPAAPAVPPPPALPPTLGEDSPSGRDTDTDDDGRYPGSRHLRAGVLGGEAEETEAEEAAPRWDGRPRVYRVGGKDVEFFTISAVADALRRKPGTIRKWETNGWIPPTRYRAPGKGKSQSRLYTRHQIEGLVILATEEGLMEPERKLRIEQTNFPARAHRLFAALDRRQ